MFIIDLDLSSSLYMNVYIWVHRSRLCYITQNEYVYVVENGIYDINTGRYFASHHFNAMG